MSSVGRKSSPLEINTIDSNSKRFKKSEEVEEIAEQNRGWLQVNVRMRELFNKYKLMGKEAATLLYGPKITYHQLSDLRKTQGWDVWYQAKRVDMDRRWEKVSSFAQKLTLTHYIFLHSCSDEMSIVQDLITHLDPDILFPAFTSSWNMRKTLRKPGEATCQSALELFEKFPYYWDDKDKGLRENLLSCDANFSRRAPNESAYHFALDNRSMIKPGTSFYQHLFSSYISNESMRAFAIQNTNKLIADRYSLAGRVLMIAVPKTSIDNESSNYVYRAHPGGARCRCRKRDGETHNDFLKQLEIENDGDPKQRFSDYPYEHQYRIVVGGLEKDSTTKVFTFDSSVIEDQKKSSEQFWRVALLLKQCQRLELLTLDTSQEQVLSVLLRTRLELPAGADYECRELYSQGLIEILQSKKSVFMKHQAYLKQHLDPNCYQSLLD